MKLVFRNAISAIAQVVFAGVLLFFLYRYLLGTIGIELLGVWSVVLAATTAAKLSEMGFSGSVVKFVAQYLARENPKKIAEVVETAAISVTLIIGLVSLLVFLPLKELLPHIVPPEGLEAAISIYPFAFLSLWINGVAGVFLSGLDGAQRVDLRSYLVTIAGAFYFLVVTLLIPKYGFIGLAYAQVLQAIFLLVGAWLLLRNQLHLCMYPRHWSRETFLEMWGYSINFQINSVMFMLYDPITKALLSKFGGLSMVGYYEMANRMIMQFRSLIVSANQVLVPVIAGMMETQQDRVHYVYKESYRLLLFISVPYFSAILISVPFISELWIGQYEPIFVIFSILLLFGWLVNLFVSPAYFAYLGIGRLRWNTLSHALIAILNGILGIALGVMFGGMGVVVAWVFALALGSLIIPIAYHYEYNISFRTLFPTEALWFAVVSCGCGVAGLWGYSRLQGVIDGPWLWLGFICIFISISTPVLWRHPMALRVKGWVAHSFKK